MLDNTPTQNIEDIEFTHAFLSFCTLVALQNSKKMNFATVFLKILQNKKMRDFYIEFINEGTEYECIRKFICTEPSITKSKYITKYLNKLKTPVL
jgi:hypothetical protein